MCRVLKTFSESDPPPPPPPSLPFFAQTTTDVVLRRCYYKYGDNIQTIVTTSELYKFYFHHPAAPRCGKHAECGFVLKVTPRLKEEVCNIVLDTEESQYTADIHCHSEVISAAHMHLVVEEYCSGRWNNVCISWPGRPEYSKEIGGVVWGSCLCTRVQ